MGRAPNGRGHGPHDLGAGGVARVHDARPGVARLAPERELPAFVAIERRAELDEVTDDGRRLTCQERDGGRIARCPRSRRAYPPRAGAGRRLRRGRPPCRPARAGSRRWRRTRPCRRGARGSRPGRAPSTSRPRQRRRRSRPRTSCATVIGGFPRRASARPSARARAATSSATSTFVSSLVSASRMFGNVIRFMCGHRLQGRTKSQVGELGRDVVAHRALGDQRQLRRALRRARAPPCPTSSRRSRPRRARPEGTPGAPGCGSRGETLAVRRRSSAVNRSWTSQCPLHRITSTLVWVATHFPRNSSGMKITRGTPSDSTTCTALADVQHTSDSAFTAADVFTYVTTGTPG